MIDTFPYLPESTAGNRDVFNLGDAICDVSENLFGGD